MMPKQLMEQEFRFIRLEKGGKKAIDKDWQKVGGNNFRHDDPELVKWMKEGGNYGVVAGFGNLVVVESDHELVDGLTKEWLPKTFAVRSAGHNGLHSYFICPDLKKNIKFLLGSEDYGQIQVKEKYVVGPGCAHPNGKRYVLEVDEEIKEVDSPTVMFAFRDFLQTLRRDNRAKEDKMMKDNDVPSVPFEKILDLDSLQRRGDEYIGAHPVHGSDTGMNFHVSAAKGVWHCFRCESGGGPLSLIAVKEGIIECSEAVRGGLVGENFGLTLEVARRKYGMEWEPKKSKLAISFKELADIIKITEDFVEDTPIYYDRTKTWWVWEKIKKKWEMQDDIDILNSLYNELGYAGIISSGKKGQYLTALQMSSRKLGPKEVPRTWVQFRDCIIDIEKGMVIEPSHEYFLTNPNPWHALNDDESCPTIDRLFGEWVGEENKELLYEICAYCLLNDYPIHRIFCFVGAGRNGKGSFMNLLEKFVGEENAVSVDLDKLNESSFELANLYKKQVALIGETNFNVLEKTSILKRAAGGDLLNAEFKHKTGFNFRNVAKIIIATNSLPTTGDRTRGFYSRWIIIDFPNIFDKGKSVVNDIPDYEFSALASICVKKLKDLVGRGEFIREKSVEEKENMYEERSNPIQKFIKEKLVEDFEGKIWFWEFKREFLSYLKKNKFRTVSDREISGQLVENGLETKRERVIKADGEEAKWLAIFGYRWKEKRVLDSMDALDVTPILARIERTANNNMASITSIASTLKAKCVWCQEWFKKEDMVEKPDKYDTRATTFTCMGCSDKVFGGKD